MRRKLIFGFLVGAVLLALWMIFGPHPSYRDMSLLEPLLVNRPNRLQETIKPPSRSFETSPSRTSDPISSLSIISYHPKPPTLQRPYHEIHKNTLIDDLKRAVESTTTPLILFSVSGDLDEPLLDHHLSLLSSHGDIVTAVGLGEQDNIQFQHDNGVLWITKVEKTDRQEGSCFGVDILETDFIIRTSILRAILKDSTAKNSLLEIFYDLHAHRKTVLSCMTPKASTLGQARHSSPFADYRAVEWEFQAKIGVLDVIDERTDQYKRVHGESGISYCNTTYSKQWYELHGIQNGSLNNAHIALSEWKLLLDELGHPLIISSGTLLGWFRQCDFIKYTSDIDTVLPIWSFTPELMTMAPKFGFHLERVFGNSSLEDPLGGWETSFTHNKTGVSLDVFFYYHDKDGKEWTSLWMTLRGPLDRVYFAPGILGNTKVADFNGIRIEVPKVPVEYLYSSYGPEWHIPKSKWTWWNSVSNQHKGPFPQWPGITSVKIHPLVKEYREKKVQANRARNRELGYPKLK